MAQIAQEQREYTLHTLECCSPFDMIILGKLSNLMPKMRFYKKKVLHFEPKRKDITTIARKWGSSHGKTPCGTTGFVVWLQGFNIKKVNMLKNHHAILSHEKRQSLPYWRPL